MPTKTKPKPRSKCASAASHRKAQNKYVAKDPKAQAARVKKSEAKHPAKVKARKKEQARGKGKTKAKTGGPKGRPRSC
jgi:hypothetical protein